MSMEFKRRTFLTGIVATLVAAPFATRWLVKKKNPVSFYRFDKEFQKYQALVDQSPTAISGPTEFDLKLSPPNETQLKYVVFLPAVISGLPTQATDAEPDGFYVREGRFTVHKTDRDQTIIYGGDEVAKFCHPTSCEDQNKNAIMLLVQNGQLVQAAEKGAEKLTRRDSQMVHLLTLKSLPNEKLALGSKWTAQNGRVKPFNNIQTKYEIVGFSEILGRKTVNVRFEGSIANIAALPGVREDIGKNEVMKDTHSGNAWFDLETGLLVRQETKTITELSGVPGLEKPLSSVGNFTVQLFHA